MGNFGHQGLNYPFISEEAATDDEIHSDGKGATVTIDTTGNVNVIKQGFEATGQRGQMLIIGVPPEDSTLSVHLIRLLQVRNLPQ